MASLPHVSTFASTLPRVAPQPQECEHDAEIVMVPFIHGGGFFSMWIGVLHHAGRFIGTEFPPDWRATMAEHCYPTDENAERLLESLAWVAWLRRQL